MAAAGGGGGGGGGLCCNPHRRRHHRHRFFFCYPHQSSLGWCSPRSIKISPNKDALSSSCNSLTCSTTSLPLPPPPSPRFWPSMGEAGSTTSSSEKECQGARLERLWQQFFLDPSQWWDKRFDKRNRKFPDFIHKTAKKALWIENMFNPPWVHAKIAAMVQCQEQRQFCFSKPEISGKVVRMEQLWQEFFSDPSQWWDNKLIKKSPKYPDFKHKSTHEGLWIENWLNPSWVEAKIATMTLGQTRSADGSRSRVADSFDNDDIVSKLCQDGRLKDALHIVELMVQQNTQLPINTYVGLLKGCARRKALTEGKRVHALIIQSGLDSGIFLGNTLVDMYAKCGSLWDARKVFSTLPEHNVFSWTAIISAYADGGQGEEAINLFRQMQQTGITPDRVAFVVVLKACARIAALEEGRQLHSKIIRSGFESDVNIGIALVDMYAKCGCIEHARLVFDNMHERNVVSWNVMITGYVQQGRGKEALDLYEKMKQEGLQPNCVTYVVLLNACANIAALEQGKHLHYHVIKCGFESDVILGNTLVDMYSKCGSIEQARRVFNNMYKRNVVSWNALIAGYEQQGLGNEALALYEEMKQEGLQPNNVTYVVLLNACASIAALEQGKQLHSHIIRSGFELDVIVSSALVDMYAKCGSVEHARQVFNSMHERNVVSWNAMIAGYAQQGLGKEALALYGQMKREDVQPNNVTYVVLLNACASFAALEQGKQLHSHIIKSGIGLDVNVWNALVDMYAKCGSLECASRVFNNMHKRDVVSWNAMIAGYAQQGLGKEAITLLEQMQREGKKPDEATYVGVLCACSHSGLVNEGRCLFDSMRKDHGVTPTVEHYACMVDLLGRAAYLADAEEFINKMPIQPDVVIWTTLLGAARNHGHVEIGRRAFDCVVKLEPDNTAAHVLLSNIYATAGRRKEVAKIRKEMKDIGVRKMPGCS